MPLLPPLAPARVREIEGFLSASVPASVPSRRARAVWDALGADAAVRERIVSLAAAFLAEPIPELSDAAYLESRRTGGRAGYPARAEDRRIRVTLFVLAEAVENGGRFLAAANREIAAICAERIWVMPPHDWNKLNFEGLRIDNDLISAMTAWTLATADAMLGDGLEAPVREALRGRIRQTVTGPFLAAIRGLREHEWWARDAYNWNSVVHAGIVGAALLLADDYSPAERAEMIAAAEEAMPSYLAGFPADGYSVEGIGYWRYGFGHFALLAEAVLAATGGKVSLYRPRSQPEAAYAHARLVARFPERFEMTRGTHFYPPFADARFPEPPAAWLHHLLEWRYGYGQPPSPIPLPEGDFAQGFFSSFLHAWGVVLGFDPGLVAGKAEQARGSDGLRDWFEASAILVARGARASVAFKGGKNGVAHGHNDLGSFLFVVGETPLLVDPGLIHYNNPDTFGPNRFRNQILGSYGHPVPLVAGQWQGSGKDFYSTVAEVAFADESDRLVLDLAPAYPVPELRTLERRFTFSRAGGGLLTVEDRFAFASPQSFGVALVSYGTFREERPGVWIVSHEGAAARIEIESDGLPFEVVDEALRDEPKAGKVRRLGITLAAPALAGRIALRILPYSL
ncbi:Heparinase II/III-like protein [Verrucomicrobium sp. GAS474]|uniref:heparinase II/III domain-containing protein n=1 Tax=Verrucomicrobium sp. GAS474 TaxID=1882831 RepID=UPI00087AB431|nr:heparinase II/III family protein [Verrucomicrobium sp. GAS474]SDT88699.1 Heparinase II/III-like protein [Verrucomicrobium sp. GAS474]